MKLVSTVVILLISFSVLLLGQERQVLSGFLVDKKCASFYITSHDKLPQHSKGCVLACGGKADFGLLLEGRFLPFDEDSGKLARQWLEKTSKERDLRVTVTFLANGDRLKVEKIE